MKKMKRYFQKNRDVRIGLVILSSLVLLFIAGVMPLQAGVQVSASLNTTSFPIDRAAALSIVVKGTRSFEPQMPEVDGLLFQQRGQSTQIEMINGAFSASVTSVYLVQGLREGRFTIPAIPITTEDGTEMTQPIDFEITAAQSSAQASSGQPSSSKTRLRSGEAEKVAFMRVTPSKEKSYSGEVVSVVIKVYFREGIKANLNTLPQLVGEGFVLQQLAPEPLQTREVINNIPYAVLTWESALSGIKEGQHTVSLELEATLLLREQRRSRDPLGHSMFSDPFFGDSFFDDFFGSYREKEVKVASPQFDLEVLSLPKEGQPEGFHGAIGQFRLSVDGDPLEVEPGEPITLTMTVRGQGNFDRVQAPELSRDEGWKSYTPSSEFLEDGGPGQGKKVFEQALVARDSTLQEIPAVTFSYFDPTDASYKVLKSNPIPFRIKGAAVEARQAEPDVKAEQTETEQADMPESVKAPIGNLAPLKLQSDGMVEEMVPLFSKRWFQVFATLAFVLLLVVAVMRQRAAANANNPRLQRHQAMKHLLVLRQKEIDRALAGNDVRGFLVSCRRAIQEQLGLLWECEAGAITLADLRKRLPEGSSLITIFSAAEESAYGGQELNSQQMQDFADRLQKELEGLL